MTLREQFGDDLDIFLDADELATEHTIRLTVSQEEKKVLCVVDDDEALQNAIKSQGTFEGNILFYARTSDLSGIEQEMMLIFDGVPFLVSGVVEDEGVTQVTLTTTQGGF